MDLEIKKIDPEKFYWIKLFVCVIIAGCIMGYIGAYANTPNCTHYREELVAINGDHNDQLGTSITKYYYTNESIYQVNTTATLEELRKKFKTGKNYYFSYCTYELSNGEINKTVQVLRSVEPSAFYTDWIYWTDK